MTDLPFSKLQNFTRGTVRCVDDNFWMVSLNTIQYSNLLLEFHDLQIIEVGTHGMYSNPAMFGARYSVEDIDIYRIAIISEEVRQKLFVYFCSHTTTYGN